MKQSCCKTNNLFKKKTTSEYLLYGNADTQQLPHIGSLENWGNWTKVLKLEKLASLTRTAIFLCSFLQETWWLLRPCFCCSCCCPMSWPPPFFSSSPSSPRRLKILEVSWAQSGEQLKSFSTNWKKYVQTSFRYSIQIVKSFSPLSWSAPEWW